MLRKGSELRIQRSFVQIPYKAKEFAQGEKKLAFLYGLDLYGEQIVVTQFHSAVLLVVERSLNS
jgi:hypothetical protein